MNLIKSDLLKAEPDIRSTVPDDEGKEDQLQKRLKEEEEDEQKSLKYRNYSARFSEQSKDR